VLVLHLRIVKSLSQCVASVIIHIGRYDLITAIGE
jgi:hypothetical protein